MTDWLKKRAYERFHLVDMKRTPSRSNMACILLISRMRKTRGGSPTPKKNKQIRKTGLMSKTSNNKFLRLGMS